MLTWLVLRNCLMCWQSLRLLATGKLLVARPVLGEQLATETSALVPRCSCTKAEETVACMVVVVRWRGSASMICLFGPAGGGFWPWAWPRALPCLRCLLLLCCSLPLWLSCPRVLRFSLLLGRPLLLLPSLSSGLLLSLFYVA